MLQIYVGLVQFYNHDIGIGGGGKGSFGIAML
jgi:hypothetical protein